MAQRLLVVLEITHTNVSTVAVTPIIPTSDRDYGFDKFHVPVASIALSDGDDSQLWGEDGFSFGDLVDLINPLQHIPGVATLYREFTGDQIAPGARLLGGTLFGGIGGAVSALVNVVVEDATGKDVGEHIVAFATGGDASGSDGTPVSPTLASNDEYPSANEPYQIAGLAAPAVPSTPAATEGKTASAASGAELLHTLTQANVIEGGRMQNAAFAPFGQTGATPVPNILGGNTGIGSMQTITQDGADVAAVLKLYEIYRQRARLNAQTQDPPNTSD